MPTSITLDSLYNMIQSQARILAGLEQRISDLEQINGIYVTQTVLQSSLQELNNQSDSVNQSILNIENKLQKITLPSDTRYYLEESEITDFRNHFRQLRSMMSEVEKSRQAFIRLAARYNLTNSTL